MLEPVTTAKGILCLCRCLTSLSAPENTELIHMSMKFHDHTLLKIFEGTSASFLLVVMLTTANSFAVFVTRASDQKMVWIKLSLHKSVAQMLYF